MLTYFYNLRQMSEKKRFSSYQKIRTVFWNLKAALCNIQIFQKLIMYWLSIVGKKPLLNWMCLRRYEMNFIPFPLLHLPNVFLAGLPCSSYVSHHYRANPSMTMFNFLWGIWSAVGKICNPVAHLSTINDSDHFPPSVVSLIWIEQLDLAIW